MDKDLGICAREKEIKSISEFVSQHVDAKQAGVLYITGPPGTGKTMSVNHVLSKIKNLPVLALNCMKAQNVSSFLGSIQDFVGIKRVQRLNEAEAMAQLTKKFSGRTSKPYLIVLDEMDQLPKMRNSKLLSSVLSWTKQEFSKLILIGISNTFNLTSRSIAISNHLTEGFENAVKIIFRPYSSKEIRSILEWYLENDENLEEANIDSTALAMISKKFALDNGDIRGAIQALHLAAQDTFQEARQSEVVFAENTTLLSPPSTPTPLTPRKQKTNIGSVSNSVRKRQRESHYFPYDQIVLVYLQRACSQNKDNSVDKNLFIGKLKDALANLPGQTYRADSLVIQSTLDCLKDQGFITFKKRRGMLSDKICFLASEDEFMKLVTNKDDIFNTIGNIRWN